jgi:hypothetical protein
MPQLHLRQHSDETRGDQKEVSTEQIVLQGDCRLLAPSDVAHCHVMGTDPPYREHVHAAATSHGKADALDEQRRGTRKRDLGFVHLAPALRRHVALLGTAMQRWSIIYSDIESLSWWRISFEARKLQYVRCVPWVRWSMPQLSGDRPPQGWEALSLFHPKGRKSWNGPGNLTCLEHKCLRGEGKHKAEKPLDQALDLVEWFSEPGQWWFDPFAGSGVFGLACKILGRNYLGIELDQEWVDKSNARIVSPTLADRDQERLRRWNEAKAAREAA